MVLEVIDDLGDLGDRLQVDAEGRDDHAIDALAPTVLRRRGRRYRPRLDG